MKLKHIGVLSLAMNTAIYAALFGLVAGLFLALFSMMGIGAGMQGAGMEGAGMMAGAGLFAIVLFPIIYGIAGFFGGLLGALFMNMAFKITGGIEMNFDQ